LDSSSMGLNFYPYFFNLKIQKENITCVSERTPVSIDVLTANEEVTGSIEVKIYPVPASEFLHIGLPEIQDMDVDLLVLDVSGKLIFKQTFKNSSSIAIDIRQFLSGLYQLILLSNHVVVSKRFIIHH